MNCDHQWSDYWPCVSPEFEYRVCYSCSKKDVQPVANPPRWVADQQKRPRHTTGQTLTHKERT